MTDSTPHSMDTEAALCASMMMEPEALQNAAVLSATAFHSDKYRRIFLACAQTFATRGVVDPLLVRDTLEQSGELHRAGGIQEIARLTKPDGFTFRHSKHYVDILQREEARRGAFLAAHDLAKIATEADAPEILAAFRERCRLLETHASREIAVRQIDWTDLMVGEMPAIPWQVNGYIAEGDFAVIAGEWGSGKSLLCMDLALSLALGSPWLGSIETAGGPHRLLYIDEENGLRLARYRMRQLLAGRGATQESAATIPITYTARNGIKLVDDRWLTWIRRHSERHKTTHLLLDSLIRFHRNDENSSSDANAFFMERIRPLMDDCGLTVIALDHMGKPSKERTDPGQRVRGTSEKPGEHDNLLCVSGSRDVNTRTLTHEKTRWDELMLPKTTKWTIADDKSSAWITCEDESPDADDAVLRIIEIGGEAGRARKEIVASLEARGVKWAARNATNTLGRLHGAGTVRRRKVGRETLYWITESAPADAS